MPRILVVEDDKAILTGVTDILRLEKFEVITSRDGAEGLKLGLSEDLDVIVLDVMLPKMDGFEILSRLRKDKVGAPILMLTARSQETDKVRGLSLGADDYLTKPFGVAEFVARVKALLRRSAKDESSSFTFGGVEVDFERHRVAKAGKEITLTAKEFELLKYLIAHRGKMLGRDDLLRGVWGYGDPPVTRTVDAHIAQLRKKLEKNPAKPVHFTSVRSVGYRFEV